MAPSRKAEKIVRASLDGKERVNLDVRREPIEIYQMPGHLIRRLQQAAVSLFHDVVQGAGFEITPVQYAALRAIESYPGIDQATLAGVIAYDRATIGGVVDRLESKGLIRRLLSPRDRRVRLLVLGPAGTRLLEELAPLVREVQNRILAPLAPEEKTAFLRLAMKLADANNEHSRAPLRPIADAGREDDRLRPFDEGNTYALPRSSRKKSSFS